MPHLNVEIKAKCDNQDTIRQLLRGKNALFHGIDHQIDTYFQVKHGRLKLREGNIENALVFYERSNQQGPKQSQVELFPTTPNSPLKNLLLKSLDTLAIVDKTREIYFIENVKFHIDTVKGLGSFIEIEAIDTDGSLEKEKLQEQCQQYLDLFQIPPENLIAVSYSDMLMKKVQE